MTSSGDDPSRPLATQLVDEIIEKYRHLLPPEALADLRERMEAFALTHPEMRKMIDRLRPRDVPGASHETGKGDAPAPVQPRAAARGKVR